MLFVWVSRLNLQGPDTRPIPPELAAFLTSPARSLPQFLLYTEDKQVLTNNSLEGKWSFVYFSHEQCLPVCEPVLTVLHGLQGKFADRDMQFLLIDFDTDNQAGLTKVLSTLQYEFVAATASAEMIEKLAKAFEFLFLRTDLSQGYMLEQQHHIYLLDPKGRVYAVFKPPFDSVMLQQIFLEIRTFYARSE
ncbi:SCO family protein [Methylophaga sp. OBS4]|uniref:SCO family protein n=1 Tax=Methylophaga sp. OBS4 TaxID=2991935 RepID=UPI00225694B2|nr:SCO family protein [Methylophaga sp. OBS4]MCX4188325.1 SCO family protein [Methylophaga sp. OBS4]